MSSNKHFNVATTIATLKYCNMDYLDNLKELGFSQYEVSCYSTLLKNHPINGSQLSKISGVSRSRVYDVLRNLMRKGVVQEVEDSLYVPLPADELLKRLQTQFEGNISVLKEQLNDISRASSFEYIWTLMGYQSVLDRAIEMIKNARTELYIRIFPKAAKILDPYLHEADNRGVGIRYIAMGDMPLTFDIQVIHPKSEKLIYTLGGRSMDIIADRKEALVGIFEKGKEDLSPISWTRNHWFVIANRDSLRHDFYHYFLDKTYDRKQELSAHEKQIYQLIKDED